MIALAITCATMAFASLITLSSVLYDIIINAFIAAPTAFPSHPIALALLFAALDLLATFFFLLFTFTKRLFTWPQGHIILFPAPSPTCKVLRGVFNLNTA